MVEFGSGYTCPEGWCPFVSHHEDALGVDLEVSTGRVIGH